MKSDMSLSDQSEMYSPANRRSARCLGTLGHRLIAGIFFAIPLVITYWVIYFGYGLLTPQRPLSVQAEAVAEKSQTSV